MLPETHLTELTDENRPWLPEKNTHDSGNCSSDYTDSSEGSEGSISGESYVFDDEELEEGEDLGSTNDGNESSESDEQDVELQVPIKRPRGRPKNIKDNQGRTENPPKRRGRPRKGTTTTTSTKDLQSKRIWTLREANEEPFPRIPKCTGPKQGHCSNSVPRSLTPQSQPIEFFQLFWPKSLRQMFVDIFCLFLSEMDLYHFQI